MEAETFSIVPGTCASRQKRKSPRRPVAASVVFNCFTTRASGRFFSGTVRDCSEDGLQIESGSGFKKGTVLMVRIMGCSFHRLPPEVKEALRTVLLAEVKWHEVCRDKMETRHLMGMRCV